MVMVVRPPRRILLIGRAVLELVVNANPLDDEDLLLDFDVALGVRDQVSLIRRDPARLQRAT